MEAPARGEATDMDHERRFAAIVVRLDKIEASLGAGLNCDVAGLTEAAASAASAAARAATAVALAASTHEASVGAAVNLAAEKLTDAVKTGMGPALSEASERGLEKYTDRLVEATKMKLGEHAELQKSTAEGLQEIKKGVAALVTAVGGEEPKLNADGLKRHSIFEGAH